MNILRGIRGVYRSSFQGWRGKKTAATKVHQFKDGGDQATFNDFPIPEGCWYKDYKQKQTRNNMLLLSGILSTLGSLALLLSLSKVQMAFILPEYPYLDEEETEQQDGEAPPG